MKKVSVIDITDLYHPYQDCGDNFDIVMPYALPEIALKAVILDTTEMFRQPVAVDCKGSILDPDGPRDPGIIPVMQLNYIFGRNVPFAVSPFTEMKSDDDKMLDVPLFQQTGIELILQVLRESNEKVDVLIFGSARTMAAAFNRNPALVFSKVNRIYICSGSSSPEYIEWNVKLDTAAFVCLLRSGLPINLYPCATGCGPFSYGPYNCYWELHNLSFIKHMDQSIKNYLGFAFRRECRMDFLRAMDEEIPESLMEDIYIRRHHVWETAVWIHVSQRCLAGKPDGSFEILPVNALNETDKILENSNLPCNVSVHDDGSLSFSLSTQESNIRIYHRGDPKMNELALNDALPKLYRSFVTK